MNLYSGLVNIQTHTIQFKDKVVRIKFAPNYKQLDVNTGEAKNIFEDELELTHVDLFNEFKVTEEDGITLVDMYKLPLFRYTSIEDFKKILQTIFGVRASTLVIDYDPEGQYTFLTTFTETGVEAVSNYEANIAIGNKSLSFKTSNVYKIRQKENDPYSYFDTEFDVINEIYNFGLTLKPMDKDRISMASLYYKLKSTKLILYPKSRNRINLVELFNAVDIIEPEKEEETNEEVFEEDARLSMIETKNKDTSKSTAVKEELTEDPRLKEETIDKSKLNATTEVIDDDLDMIKCKYAVIQYKELNKYKSLYKASVIKTKRKFHEELTTTEGNKLIINGKSIRKMIKNTLRLYLDNPYIETITIYLDGTLYFDLRSPLIDHIVYDEVMKVVESLHIREFETKYRPNNGYVVTTTDNNLSVLMDFQIDFEKTDTFGKYFMYVLDNNSERVSLNTMPTFNINLLFHIFQETYRKPIIKEEIFKREFYSPISLRYTDATAYDETVFKTTTYDPNSTNIKTLIEFKHVNELEEVDFLLNFLMAVVDKLKMNDSNKEKKIVKQKLQSIRDHDPRLFGYYMVNGKRIAYSKLVCHDYERPKIITEDVYNDLLMSSPTSVVSIQNQTYPTERTYLHCNHHLYQNISFRQSDTSCYPRCTKTTRANSQYNVCIDKLGGIYSRPSTVVNRRIVDFKQGLMPGQRCSIPDNISILFPKCYFEVIELEPEYSDIRHYCMENYGVPPLVISYNDTEIIAYNIETIWSSYGMVVLLPIIAGKIPDDPMKERVFYIMSKSNHLNKILPVTKYPELRNAIRKQREDRMNEHKRYYKDHIKAGKLVNHNGYIIGFVTEDKKMYCSLKPYKSLYGEQFHNIVSQIEGGLEFPSIDDFIAPQAVSIDGNSVMIDGTNFVCKHVESTVLPRVVADGYTNLLHDLRITDMTKSQLITTTDEQLKAYNVIKLIERMLTKGITSETSLKENNLIGDRTVIYVMKFHLVSLTKSKITLEDFKKYLSQANDMTYVSDNYSLPLHTDEILDIIY